MASQSGDDPQEDLAKMGSQDIYIYIYESNYLKKHILLVFLWVSYLNDV